MLGAGLSQDPGHHDTADKPLPSPLGSGRGHYGIWEEAQQTVVIAFRGAIEALSREALRKLIAGLKEAPGALDALRAAAAHPLVYAVLRRHG